MVIAIDFDGTLHDWHHPVEGRKMGPPMEGAKAALDRLRELGHKLVIHSCNNEVVIADWMEYFNIPYDLIWTQKPNCDLFIDDRAVPFTSWAEIMGETLAPKA